jgi:hypothetical protein
VNAFFILLCYYLVGGNMEKNEKIILILGIVIILILFLNVFSFFKKNTSLVSNIKLKKEYEAIVINKRHYVDNNRNLFYVTFAYDDMENEFLVSECIYNTLNMNQEGILVLKYDYFIDFK